MPPARPAAPQLNARRAEICRTAAQIIHERGYDATSVSDIARALGMTKAGLYHYISGKEALLFEIMNFGMDQMATEVVNPAKEILDPEERLREIVRRHAGIVLKSRGAVTQLVDEVRGLPPASRRKVQKRMRAYFDLLRETLVELQKAGRLRDLDPTVATFSTLAMILWIPRWYRPHGRLTADHVARDLATMATGALLLPERTTPQPRPRRPATPRRVKPAAARAAEADTSQ